MSRHAYARTERDLRRVAVGFSAGNIKAGDLPLILDVISANLRLTLEAEKACNGYAHDTPEAMKRQGLAMAAARAAGVTLSFEGE